MKNNIFVTVFSLLILFVFVPQNASADMFKKGFKLRAGGYWAYLDSSLNAGIPGTGLGTKIDFESDLGLEESKFSPFLEASYHFNERHAVLLNYVSLHRSGTTAAVTKPFEFEWSGKIYQISAGIGLETVLDLDIYQTAYMYSFYASDKAILAGTIGAHIAKIKTGFKGKLGIVGGPVATSQDIDESLTAPLPDIGLLAYYKLDYGMILGARAQYFQLAINDIDGSMLDLRAEVLKYFDASHHWAIGAAYQFYGVEINYEAANTKIDLEIDYQGPSVFVQYDF